jgi:hypothetical protein
MANVEMDVIRENKDEPPLAEAAVGDVGYNKMQSIAERDDAALRRVGRQPVLKEWFYMNFVCKRSSS